MIPTSFRTAGAAFGGPPSPKVARRRGGERAATLARLRRYFRGGVT
jgi:hypothetical protein